MRRRWRRPRGYGDSRCSVTSVSIVHTLSRRRPQTESFRSTEFLRTIAGGIDRATGVLDIAERDVERVIRYAAKYGGGGFQGRLGPLAAALAAQR